jgi:hypothetical protein
MGLAIEEARFDSQQWEGIFLFPITPIPALGLINLLCTGYRGPFFLFKGAGTRT